MNNDEIKQYFRYKCEKGLAEKKLDSKEYLDRLEYEIGIISSMNFEGYFLIVQDFVNWAHTNNIYIGPGRGSAAGSLISYCLGITNLDPVKWGLLFERFLNPDRISQPDIDLDTEKRYRHLILDYITNKYGTDRVVHIGTFGRMKAKAAVKAVARTLGYPYKIGDDLTKLLLPPIHGKPQPLKVSIEKIDKLNSIVSGPETEYSLTLKWAQKVEDLVANAGIHASGIVIANESLLDKIPLFKGKEGEVTTQWEMNNIEDIGYIKFDILGVDALDKIHIAIDLIKQRHGITIDINNIPLDDPKTFSNLRSGDTVGIFQLEASAGIRDLLVQIRPVVIEDIAALVAIYRPGPLSSDYLPQYLSVRSGLTKPNYLIPELESILQKTSGWLIYQEQVMEIAKKLCGYTGGQADEMRKAVGKKKADLMATHESKFKDGWIANGYSKESASKIWNDIVGFAAYGFNYSHAAAYGTITYQTSYLKTHFPTEFLCAILLCVAGNQDKVIRIISECRRLGIEVLPPDINESEESFSIVGDKKIRFGLGPIKNLGNKPVQEILDRRSEGLFTSLSNFCQRTNLSIINRLKLESLIKAGAFDQFEGSRAAKLQQIEDIWKYNKEHKSYLTKVETYNRKMEACQQRVKDIEEGKKSVGGKALQLLKAPEYQPIEPLFPSIYSIPEMDKLTLLNEEHELLGFFVSGHPMDSYQRPKNSITIEETKERPHSNSVIVSGVVTSRKELTTSKNKQKMAFLTLEDLTGSLEINCFPNVYTSCSSLLDMNIPITIHGITDVAEADEGDKVTKIVAKKIVELKYEGIPQLTSIEVRSVDLDKLTNDLKGYIGNSNKLRITILFEDGSCGEVTVNTTVLPSKIYKDYYESAKN